MVKINCNEIKLEDITVTFHPNKDNIPAVIITEDKQIIIGTSINLICLNIIKRATIKKINIDIPNTFKSFLTNFITSFEIIERPPKKILSLLLYGDIIFLISLMVTSFLEIKCYL